MLSVEAIAIRRLRLFQKYDEFFQNRSFFLMKVSYCCCYKLVKNFKFSEQMTVWSLFPE